MKKSFFQRGFTLLELLVVISLIGILIAMGTVAFATAQKRGRDAKRRGDLQAIQKAQEQYYSLNNSYVVWGDQTCTGSIGTVMTTVPTDPKNNATYYYWCHSVQEGYCVEVTLEDATGGNCSACTWDGSAYSLSAGTTKYCVTNLQ